MRRRRVRIGRFSTARVTSDERARGAERPIHSVGADTYAGTDGSGRSNPIAGTSPVTDRSDRPGPTADDAVRSGLVSWPVSFRGRTENRAESGEVQQAPNSVGNVIQPERFAPFEGRVAKAYQGAKGG